MIKNRTSRSGWWAAALSALATAVVLGSLGAAAHHQANESKRAVPPRTVQPAGNIQADDVIVSPVTPMLPTYLPAGATLARQEMLPDGEAELEFSLPGISNADTVTGSDPLNTSPDIHPVTLITLTESNDGAQGLADAGADPAIFNLTTVGRDGVQYRLIEPKDGFGPLRIDWVKGVNRFTLITARMRTATGDSGVSMPELLRVAESI